MSRRETREDFIELVRTLKTRIPHLVLSTDIIVGFPGETEEDYELTKSMIKETRPIIVNISKYTDRPGTKASKMRKKIPTKIKSVRSKDLSQICRRISQEELKSWIGTTSPVLIEEVGKYGNQVKARNSSYLPVVINEGGIEIGSIHQVSIIGTAVNYLIGEMNR